MANTLPSQNLSSSNVFYTPPAVTNTPASYDFSGLQSNVNVNTANSTPMTGSFWGSSNDKVKNSLPTSPDANTQQPVAPVAQKTSSSGTPVVKSKTTQQAAPITPAAQPVLDSSNSFDVYNAQGQKKNIPAEKLFDYQNAGWSLQNTSGVTPDGEKAGTNVPTPTPTPSETGTTPDTSTRITNLLNQGYSTPENIATATGLSVDEVNNFLSSNETASYMLKSNQITNQADEAYQNYNAKVEAITNGSFALTAEEQADIQRIKDTFARLRELQVTANKNYEGAVGTAEIRSGRQEFMNQISSGIQKQAIDDGVQKVQDIEAQALDKIREYKTAIADKNYKAAATAYEATNKYLDSKSKAIKELHDSTVAMYKAQQESITAGLENAKLKQDLAKNTIEGLAPSLANADQATINEIASYYGIDPNMLVGNIKASAQKMDADMAAKGFMTINPADAGKMKAIGAEVTSYNGRFYAKDPEIKSVTNKGNVDFFKGTQKIASVPLTGGGPSGGQSSEEKLAAAVQKDINTIQEEAAKGTYTIDAARKMLWSRYGASPSRPGGLTNETISILIPD